MFYIVCRGFVWLILDSLECGALGFFFRTHPATSLSLTFSLFPHSLSSPLLDLKSCLFESLYKFPFVKSTKKTSRRFFHDQLTWAHQKSVYHSGSLGDKAVNSKITVSLLHHVTKNKRFMIGSLLIRNFRFACDDWCSVDVLWVRILVSCVHRSVERGGQRSSRMQNCF